MKIDLKWEKIVVEDGIEHRYLVDMYNYFFLVPSGYKLKRNIEKSIKNAEESSPELNDVLLKILHSLNEDIIFATIIKLHLDEEDFYIAKPTSIYLDFSLDEDIMEYHISKFFKLLKNYKDCMIEAILNIYNMSREYNLSYKSNNNSLNFTEQFIKFERVFKKIPLTELFIDIFYFFKISPKDDISIDIDLPSRAIEPVSFKEMITSFKNEEYSNFIGLLYLPIELNRLNFTFNVGEEIQPQDIKKLSKLINSISKEKYLFDYSERCFKNFINRTEDIIELKKNATEILKIKLKRLLKHRENFFIKLIQMERSLNSNNYQNIIIDDIKLLEKKMPEFKNKIYFIKDFLERNYGYKLEKSKNTNYLINGFIESSEIIFQLSSPFFKRNLSYERTSYLKWRLKKIFKEMNLSYELDIKPLERSYRNEINYKPLENIFSKIDKINLIIAIQLLKIDIRIPAKEYPIKYDNSKDEDKKKYTDKDKGVNWFLNRFQNTIKKDIIEKEEMIFQILTINNNEKIRPSLCYVEIVKNFLFFVDWCNQKNKANEKKFFLQLIHENKHLLKGEIKDFLKSHENDLKKFNGELEKNYIQYIKDNYKKHTKIKNFKEYIEEIEDIEELEDKFAEGAQIKKLKNYIIGSSTNSIKEAKIKRLEGRLGINASDLINFENLLRIAMQLYLEIENGKLKLVYNFEDEIVKEYPYIIMDFNTDFNGDKMSRLSYFMERQNKIGMENKQMIKKMYFEIIDYYINEGRKEIKF